MGSPTYSIKLIKCIAHLQCVSSVFHFLVTSTLMVEFAPCIACIYLVQCRTYSLIKKCMFSTQMYVGALSVGAIAGVAVGGVLFIALFVGVLFCFGKH